MASLRDIAEGAIAAGQFASSTRLIASSRPLRSTSALTSERRARDYLAVWSNTLPARVERADDTTVSIQGAFSTDDRGSNRKGVPALVRRRSPEVRAQTERSDAGRFRNSGKESERARRARPENPDAMARNRGASETRCRATKDRLLITTSCSKRLRGK